MQKFHRFGVRTQRAGFPLPLREIDVQAAYHGLKTRTSSMKAPRKGVVLDAGAFIALDRRNPVMVHLTRRFAEEGTPLVTSAGVVAQVWRAAALRCPSSTCFVAPKSWA